MVEKRNIGSGDRRGGLKRKTGQQGGNSRNITYNRNELLKYERELERLKKLDNYTPSIPNPPSGAGEVYTCIQEMNRTVMDIYNQVDLLIEATTKALRAINVEITAADNEAAYQYRKSLEENL